MHDQSRIGCMPHVGCLQEAEHHHSGYTPLWSEVGPHSWNPVSFISCISCFLLPQQSVRTTQYSQVHRVLLYSSPLLRLLMPENSRLPMFQVISPLQVGVWHSCLHDAPRDQASDLRSESNQSNCKPRLTKALGHMHKTLCLCNSLNMCPIRHLGRGVFRNSYIRYPR